MLTVNENVMQRDKELKVELSLAQSNEQEILARLVMFQRMTKQLNARINQEEEKNRVADEVHEKELAAKVNSVMLLWIEAIMHYYDGFSYLFFVCVPVG